MAAVRITSGPLRGVELETGVQRSRRMRLLMRAWRRRSAAPPYAPAPRPAARP